MIVETPAGNVYDVRKIKGSPKRLARRLDYDPELGWYVAGRDHFIPDLLGLGASNVATALQAEYRDLLAGEL